ncbi:MAG: alpha-galactosidase [Planctomycetia bacterium]|nr:alpha-galactosidase [Planctomycetia bacterium]
MNLIAALFTLVLGPWMISFDENTSQLTIKNQEQAIEVQGKLSFESEGKIWKIGLPRDNVARRLALISPQNSVQGYLSFQGDPNRIEFLVHHRTRQFYSGKLRFEGDVQFKKGSFACRTKPVKGERVLSLGTGASDSALNDSLFCDQLDLLVQFFGSGLKIDSKGNGLYGLSFEGAIEQASESAFGLQIMEHYFKDRYVPYYTPIDRKRCPSAPTGWMSWNLYFDKATAEDNLAEARMGKKYLQPFGLEFWSIESWQGNSDQLPVSKFYNLDREANEKQFPKGMKQLADDIRALGFRPGLWVVPYGTGNEEFYKKHKDWFLHDKKGNPLRTWAGLFTPDPTNEEYIAHMIKTLDIQSHEWGYEFFKVDGMSGSGPGYCAHFYEMPSVRSQFKDPNCKNAFEITVNAIRKGIGPDRVFLACQGHATGPEAAVADASRIGSDIVHPNKPVGWNNLMQQAGRTLNQIFTHNIVFFADPDTLLVNEALSMEEARLSTTVVSLPGQMMFSGDKLAELPMERVALLQKTLPVCDIHPMNLYPYFEMLPVWNLKVDRNFLDWDVVALFNWTEKNDKVKFDFAELGLDSKADYLLYEYWTNQFKGSVHGSFEMEVPAHGVRLLAVHRKQDVPQFLSSDRHITQGAVDLTGLLMNRAEKKLEGSVKLIANHKTALRFYLPENWEIKGIDASKNVKAEFKTEENGRIAVLNLIAPKNAESQFVLKFK